MGSGNSTINHPSMTILVVLERGARYTVFISSRQEPPGAGWLAEKKASLVSMRQQKNWELIWFIIGGLVLFSLLVFSHMCAVYRQIRRNTVRRRSPFMTNVD